MSRGTNAIALVYTVRVLLMLSGPKSEVVRNRA